MEQYKDKAIEHVETNKKTKVKIVTDRQRVVYKLIEDGHWTRKYFRGIFTDVVNKFRWKNQKFLNSHIFYTTCKFCIGILLLVIAKPVFAVSSGAKRSDS